MYFFSGGKNVNLIKHMAAALAIITAVSFIGCESKKTDTAPEPVTEAVTISPQNIVFDWQSLYESKLSEFKNSDKFSESSDSYGCSMFDLRDLTNDGTPELIISPNTDAASACEIYTVSKGSLVYIGESGSSGCFNAFPLTGIIQNEHMGQGFIIGEYLSFSDNSLNTVLSYYNNADSILSGASLTYEINKEEVTLAEYDAALEEYLSAPSLMIGRKYTFTDASINYALYFSESWGGVLTDKHKSLFRNKLSELINEGYDEAAFELCDLNADNTPELIVSTGTYKAAVCMIFIIENNTLSELETHFDSSGRICFDIENKVYFSSDISGNHYNSLIGADLEAYRESESIMECGRKYLLKDEFIISAFQ